MTAGAAVAVLAPARNLFLPVEAIPQWLPADRAGQILAYAIENESRFTPGSVLYEGDRKVDLQFRRTLVLRTLGEFEPLLREAAASSLPSLERAMGISPFSVQHYEIELAAHGDGALFKKHIDTFVGASRRLSTRVLTLVYYLNREPKAYRGGSLRMYSVGGRQVRDLEPQHNLLVAFPSCAPHSVEEVHCPSREFADSRFAVNLWIHRQAPGPPAADLLREENT